MVLLRGDRDVSEFAPLREAIDILGKSRDEIAREGCELEGAKSKEGWFDAGGNAEMDCALSARAASAASSSSLRFLAWLR